MRSLVTVTLDTYLAPDRVRAASTPLVVVGAIAGYTPSHSKQSVLYVPHRVTRLICSTCVPMIRTCICGTPDFLGLPSLQRPSVYLAPVAALFYVIPSTRTGSPTVESRSARRAPHTVRTAHCSATAWFGNVHPQAFRSDLQ